MSDAGELSGRSLVQAWPEPTQMRPVFVIGAGGIVNDAHLPAYQSLRIPIAGVYDIDASRAGETAERWGVPVHAALPAKSEAADWIFDIATPPEAVAATLEQLPDGVGVLIQKPMGRNLAEADAILEVCERKQLRAALNFQLRFAPMVLALLDARDSGWFGDIVELDVHVNCHMPWELWPFLRSLERMELALHSIHYLDVLRAIAGDPVGVHARTLQHPWCADLASTRSTALIDFPGAIRCCLSVNHHHEYGSRFARSELRVEGTEGAALMRMGVNLNYPEGEPDELWLARRGEQWRQIELSGNWFPDAFRGPMSNLQRFVAGADSELVTRVHDAWKTMALLEACYVSAAAPATPIPQRGSSRAP